ncbi:MAG: helix-turn-helix transcriptional regulator [Spirochaetia bacterium]|nr:helix-turn-helix transcriptional regulator [Spirochaetia bacterium]
MSFKENLKSELEYQGLQIKELAVKCGISRNTLANYLTGHNSLPTADNAVKIAQTLGVSVEYLMTGDSSTKALIDSLPPKYRKLLKVFQTLDETDQEAVLHLITILQKRHQ